MTLSLYSSHAGRCVAGEQPGFQCVLDASSLGKAQGPQSVCNFKFLLISLVGWHDVMFHSLSLSHPVGMLMFLERLPAVSAHLQPPSICRNPGKLQESLITAVIDCHTEVGG